MRAWSELRHEGEGPGRGHEDVRHCHVITPRATHSHDIPGVDHLATFTREIRHHHFRLTRIRCPSWISSHHCCRRSDPVGVITIADEGRTPGNAIPALDRGCLHRASK